MSQVKLWVKLWPKVKTSPWLKNNRTVPVNAIDFETVVVRKSEIAEANRAFRLDLSFVLKNNFAEKVKVKKKLI